MKSPVSLIAGKITRPQAAPTVEEIAPIATAKALCRGGNHCFEILKRDVTTIPPAREEKSLETCTESKFLPERYHHQEVAARPRPPSFITPRPNRSFKRPPIGYDRSKLKLPIERRLSIPEMKLPLSKLTSLVTE
eukprot:snap_masked-scaffold_53-processed-gene-1.76-mRNA-1 protein AED:1.00 eAED:1.00 QI:0/-1/0/0/-1/1/1/0/134